MTSVDYLNYTNKGWKLMKHQILLKDELDRQKKITSRPRREREQLVEPIAEAWQMLLFGK
jgi:hypothetical protein